MAANKEYERPVENTMKSTNYRFLINNQSGDQISIDDPTLPGTAGVTTPVSIMNFMILAGIARGLHGPPGNAVRGQKLHPIKNNAWYTKSRQKCANLASNRHKSANIDFGSITNHFDIGQINCIEPQGNFSSKSPLSNNRSRNRYRSIILISRV